jgi:hypothetical protein
MKYQRILQFISVLIILAFPQAVFAYQVEALPEDNLLENPWFRDPGRPNHSSLAGWIDAAGPNAHWSSSQKEANPTPDQIVSGDCGSQELYCGTAARLDPGRGQSGGVAIPGVDAYLYQVVPADQSHRKLKFFAHYVSHLVEVAEVSIYGGDIADGPWELAWVPLHYRQDVLIKPPRGESTEALWEQTGYIETVLREGYDYYKVEIHARLPEGNDTGFKITGIYFSTSLTDEPPSVQLLTTPTTADEPGPGETQLPEESDGRATREARRTQMAEESNEPTATASIHPSPTPAPTQTTTPVPTSTAQLVEPEGSRMPPGFAIWLLTGGLVILLSFGGVLLYKNVIKKN